MAVGSDYNFLEKSRKETSSKNKVCLNDTELSKHPKKKVVTFLREGNKDRRNIKHVPR